MARKSAPKKSAKRPANPRKTKALSSFDGANHSTSRGWIYFPTLDTHREIDSYTHWELVKKARWFFANSGFARRVVKGCGTMVGYLTPKAITDDKEWNDLAEKSFENRAGSAQVVDLMGKHSYYSIQPKLIGNMLKDGDLLLALTKTSSGGAAFMPYEAQQIGNGRDTKPEEGWDNGVLTNNFSRHLAYRILDGNDHYDVAAQDAIYFADFERLNQTRGLTGFAHAINHLHDRTEIFRDTKLALKNSSQWGFYKARPGPQAKGRGMGVGRNQKVVTPSGETVDIEEVFRGGKLASLAEGEEIRTLVDGRPHPQQMALDDWLVRDMAWGFGLSPEILWFVGNVNGTTNRFLLADAQKWVEEKQQMLIDLFCVRFWVYFVACEMKAGRLRKCTDPDWWKVGFIPQPKLTVDRSRDGKLNIDLHRGGLMTMKRHYAENWSEDWKPNADDWMDELAYLRDGLKARGFENMAEVQALLGQPNAAKMLPAPDDITPQTGEDSEEE